jgi:RNA polymerase sigma factor (sigma-70 family)
VTGSVGADGEFDGCFPDLFACAYRVAFRLTGHRQEAEDLAIEAVARASTRWDQVCTYREAWVVRTTTNLALDLLRRGRAPAAVGPAAVVDGTSEQRVDLARALRRLPRRQREVVALRYLGDRSEREVAGLLGISPGSVKQHATRGLAALRAELPGYALAAEEVDDVR